MKKKELKIEIIFEDSDIVVLSKTAGVFTIPDRYDRQALNLYNFLQNKYGKIFTVHRLDRDTSGVIVFAKNAESHKNLNQQFQDHLVKKIYHVVISGIIRQDVIDIDIPISDNPGKKGLSIPSARGKQSLTKLKVLERFRNATLCECSLITGRHHQIRMHCSAIGYPLLVDEQYGNSGTFYLSAIKRKYNLRKDTEEKPVIKRITMHSYELTFNHPVTNAKSTFISEYPRDFSALLQILRKYAALPEFSMHNI
ncbi:RluA family pseudouridine synthase [Bacteroidota bacterium]